MYAFSDSFADCKPFIWDKQTCIRSHFKPTLIDLKPQQIINYAYYILRFKFEILDYIFKRITCIFYNKENIFIETISNNLNY